MKPLPQRKYALLFSLFLVLSAALAAVTPAGAETPDDGSLSARHCQPCE